MLLVQTLSQGWGEGDRGGVCGGVVGGGGEGLQLSIISSLLGISISMVYQLTSYNTSIRLYDSLSYFLWEIRKYKLNVVVINLTVFNFMSL